MKPGDLVRMKNCADGREFPPKGIIVETRHPAGHRFQRHTIVWDDGVMSEIPEDILMVINESR